VVLHGRLERCRQLLIVTLLANLAILVLCAFGVDAANEIVQLRCGKDLVVGIFDFGGTESVYERSDKRRARSTGVAGEYYAGGGVVVNFEVGCKFLVEGEESLV
jgi:hypothetical protein